MRYYRRNIVMTKCPLQEAFCYRDIFIIQPIIRRDIPYSPYAKDYPAYLDYWHDEDEGKDELELIQLDINKTREICALLTAMSNFEFFTYDSSLNVWGVAAPDRSFDSMTTEEIDTFNANARNSIWVPFPGYMYKEFSIDRIVSELSVLDGNNLMTLDENPLYFTDNPIEENKNKICFHKNLIDALDSFYALKDGARQIVFSAIVLIANAIKFGLPHQSIGFVSFISSIETMVELENKGVKVHHCENCGQPIYAVKKKFIDYLVKYVSNTEKSKKKFNDLYKLRSKIAHTGKLFLSDVEFSLMNIEQNNNEWIKYVEVRQLARLSLYRWLLINRSK